MRLNDNMHVTMVSKLICQLFIQRLFETNTFRLKTNKISEIEETSREQHFSRKKNPFFNPLMHQSHFSGSTLNPHYRKSMSACDYIIL
jgi:hypothetical protein